MDRRLAPNSLPLSDRAFVESMAGIHQQLEALKIAYADDPRKGTVLAALQAAAIKLTAAIVATPALEDRRR